MFIFYIYVQKASGLGLISSMRLGDIQSLKLAGKFCIQSFKVYVLSSLETNKKKVVTNIRN